MAVPNAVSVLGRKRIKETRQFLERLGYYDSSRRIAPTAGNCFALPVTPLAVELLRGLQRSESMGIILPVGAGVATLTNADLPASKARIARDATGRSRLLKAVGELIERLEPPLSCAERTRLLSEVPRSWERHGDLILLPSQSLKSETWQRVDKEELWTVVMETLRCKRLAKDARISPDGFRSSAAALLVGTSPWVEHIDNGVTYVLDVTQTMFSSGNVTEKLRIGQWDCRHETVVDMFAGIGYFTMPYLVHSWAKVVHACEWNPVAMEGLRRGLVANGVSERCTLHEGDCRKVCPRGIADRVNLGLLPSSECAWAAACAALRPDRGGWLHIHGNVCCKPGSCGWVEHNPWEEGEEEEEEAKEGEGEGEGEEGEGEEEEEEERAVKIIEEREEGGGEEEEKEKEKEENEDEEEVKERTVRVQKAEEEEKEEKGEEAAWRRWREHTRRRIAKLLKEGNPLGGGCVWSVAVRGVVRVKRYAPHVDHLVADLECRPVSGHTELRRPM